MAVCILFKDRDMRGNSLHLGASERDLRNRGEGNGNWNDETSSIRIVSGTWQFFDHINFDGARSPVLGPGDYPTHDHFGLPNDVMSSVLKVSD